jgi:hypothetical protein
LDKTSCTNNCFKEYIVMIEFPTDSAVSLELTSHVVFLS